MTIHELQITYLACPLCNSQSNLIGEVDCTRYANWHEPLPKKLEWMQCNLCGHVYTQQYWSDAGLTEIFVNAHNTQQAGISVNPDLKRTIWTPVVERVISLFLNDSRYSQLFGVSNPPVWLDVGCGDGALTMTAADFGFEVIGLDVRSTTVKRIKELGFTAYQGDFMNINFEGNPKVISMMDVLEHMPFPREALQKAQKILGSKGIIVLSLPDMSCSSWRILDMAKANPYWIEMEHFHNFSRSRIFSLLSECGFEVVNFTIPQRYKAQMEIYAIKR